MKTKLLLSLCSAAFLCSQGFAADYFYNGTETKSWQDLVGANVTTIDDQLRISGGGTLDIDLGSGSTALIGNFEHSDATINMNVGQIDAGDIVLGSGATVNINTGATLAYTAKNASGVNVRLAIGRAGGTGTMNVNGGLLTTNTDAGVNSTLNVAHDGTGTTGILNITNGGQVKKGDNGNFFVNVGSTAAGSTATVNISGTGSLLQVGNNSVGNSALNVGTAASSIANINISDGGLLEIMRGSASDTTITLGTGTAGDANKSTAKINVNSGGKLLFSNATNNASLNFAAGSNSDSGIFVNQGGVMDVTSTAGTQLKLGTAGGGTFLIEANGGIINVNASGGDTTFIMTDTDGGTTSKIAITNGGQFLQTGGNVQLEIGRHGGADFVVESGGAVRLNGNIQVGTRDKASAVGVISLDNGTIYGTAGVGSYAGYMELGRRNYTTATLEMKNNSQAYVREFYVGMGRDSLEAVKGTGITAYVTLEGLNTQLKVANQITIGADGVLGNSVDVQIYSGAQLMQVNNSAFVIDHSAKVTFNLQGSLIPAAEAISMIYARQLTVKNAYSLHIDGSSLGIAAIPEGDYSILLMEFTTGTVITLGSDVFTVGTDADSDILVALKDFVNVENNTGNIGWDDFSKDDLAFADGKLTLAIHAIPEPGAYALLFGSLALAFAVYRRRK